jgi:selenide,water dikinase
VPLLPELDSYLEANSIPGGTQRNWDSYGEKIGPVSDLQRNLLCDPQTSGGLLVAVQEEGVDAYKELTKEFGLPEYARVPLGQLRSRDESDKYFITVA